MKSQDQQLLEEAYKKVKKPKMSSKMSSKKKMMKESIDVDEMDGYELMEVYMDKTAVRYDDEQDLTNLIEVLGYRQGLREFFGDNPGAIEAIYNWVFDTIDKVPDWKENLRDELRGMMEDSEEDSEEKEEFGGSNPDQRLNPDRFN
jgi:hypothetical protein